MCCGLKDNNWYYFNELSGKWKQTEQGHVLRSSLSADIIDLYQHYSNYYKDKSKDDKKPKKNGKPSSSTTEENEVSV